MIKFVIARNKDDKEIYEKYIGKYFSNRETVSYDVFDKEGETLTLTKKYNDAIEHIKDSLNDNDIVIFVHNDVEILDKCFEEKVEMVFSNPKIGLLGVIGCLEYKENCMWWANEPDKLVGHIVQEHSNNEETHLIKGNIGYSDNVICCDGLMLMIRGKILKDGMRFDEQFDFNFYDISFCLDMLINTEYKVAVADILVKHKSEGLGSLTDEWKIGKEKLIQKYTKRGILFPFTIQLIENLKVKS